MYRTAAVVLLFLAGTAQADPGHGIASLWHLLTEPDHLALILLPVVLIIGIIGVRATFPRRKARDRTRTSESRPRP